MAVEDMVKLLKTGQNRFATVSGSMTEVIHHSTQHISNDDLAAIATYGDTPGAMSALVDVLLGRARAPGRLPVDVAGVERAGC